jgi:hypothetical protein
MTDDQAEEAAKLYVQKRLEQDGGVRSWQEHVDTARCMIAWREALQPAAMEYQLAKLELRPGDILVLKMNQASILHADEMLRIRRELTKFIGSECRVMTIDSETELSVVTREGEG